MNRECARCREAEIIDHCHGTLILHTDGALECTDELCWREIEARHMLVVDCGELVDGCGCADPLPERYGRAS